MYESFFELAARPFAAAPDPNLYFAGESIESARQAIIRCLSREEGTALLIGGTGSGKSLLCKVLQGQLAEQFQVVALRGGDVTSRRSLYQAILRGLNLPYRLDEGELRLSLADYAEHGTGGGSGLALLVDEAQSLPVSLLEELRLITNLTRDDHAWARLAIFGSPELEERFTHPKLEAFNQRLAVRCYLQPFDKSQTRQYIYSRIRAVGGAAEKLFTDDAFEKIFIATDGVARRVNQVCDHALVLAYAGGKRTITGSGIEEAWADLQQLPIPFAADRVAERSEPAESIVEFGNLSDEEEPAPMFVSPPAPRSNPLAEVAAQTNSNLDRIAAHLGKLEQEYRANPTGDGVRFAFQEPRGKHVDTFEHEEVLVDRYAKLDAVASAESRRATSPPAGQWPPLSSQIPTKAEGPAHSASETKLSEIDDSDMIVLEDERETLPLHQVPRPTAKRREYGQLFAKLRRG